MTTSATAEFRRSPSFKRINKVVIQRTQLVAERPYSLAIWVTLIGIFFPPVLIPLGGINVTPGRFVIMLLFLPALGVFFKGGRKRIATDFFAVALAIWMVASAILNGGFKPYVGAEAVEFIGAYMIGRAFVFGPSNLRTFIKAFKIIAVVVVSLAVLDVVSGRYVVMESLGLLDYRNVRINFRGGLLRASSVFEGGEHFGTICVAAAAIFLYSERGVRRLLNVGLSFFGCALSLSSGPLMALGIITTIFSYDRFLKQYPWRWKALSTTVVGGIIVIFLLVQNPIEWAIAHLTLDHQTAWFRIGTWDSAMPLIGESPITGHGLADLEATGNAALYLSSVDCIWLVEALRYGLPAVILLILTMVSPFLRKRRISTFDPSVYHAATGFSLAIVAFGLIGLTVHFWNAPWQFLSLCIGIRASLAEYERLQQPFIGVAENFRFWRGDRLRPVPETPS
jgi:hypothetical protein